MLSDERMGLSFTIAAGPRQRGHSQVCIPRDSWPHFTVSDSRLPQPGRPGPYIYIRQEQGGPENPQALGSIFVASYDSRTWDSRYIASGRPPQKIPFPNNFSIFIEVCLFCRCIETEVILLFTELLPSNSRLLRFHYSEFRASCHNTVVTWRLKTGMMESDQTFIAEQRLINYVSAAANIKDYFPLQRISANESLPGSKLLNTRFPLQPTG
jgi:hypothetical protein